MIFSFTGGPTGGGEEGGDKVDARFSCDRGSLQSPEESEAGSGDVTLNPAAVSHYLAGWQQSRLSHFAHQRGTLLL